MKIIPIFILGILPLLSSGQLINIGMDQCSHCGMLIQDRNFAAQMTEKGLLNMGIKYLL